MRIRTARGEEGKRGDKSARAKRIGKKRRDEATEKERDRGRDTRGKSQKKIGT